MTDPAKEFMMAVPSIRRFHKKVMKNVPISGEPVEIPCREGGILIYVHRSSRERAPVVFEFHGGGFVLGDASENDNFRERLKNDTDLTVIGVNYRKAPEFPYPHAWQDAYDAVKYVHDHPEAFGIDPERMAVVGFSAGANLATIVAMKAAASGDFELKCQILHYPYVDGASDPAAKERHPADIPVFTMQAFDEAYSGGIDKKRSDVSPLYATLEELQGTAPAALFMAGEDALMSEGFAYAARLEQARVEILAKEAAAEMHHGYMEDYFNKALYDTKLDKTISLHSPKMGEQAEKMLRKTGEILKRILLPE